MPTGISVTMEVDKVVKLEVLTVLVEELMEAVLLPPPVSNE